MSDIENPYASPQAESIPENKLITQPSLTDTMLRYLKEAAPWLRFLGVLGFISCGFMAICGITVIIAMGSFSSAWETMLDSGPYSEAVSSIFSISMGLNFIIYAVLFFFPTRFMYKFGVKIRSYLQSGKEQELELALKNNKSLWKFMGILMIISLAIIPVFIAIAIITVAVSVLI